MANEYAPWEPAHPVVYSAASDEMVMTAWQKYIAECARLYTLLNRVRTMDAGAGTAVDDCVPYQLKVNTVTDELLVRQKDNSAWTTLGKLAEHFGVTPEDIDAVRTSGGVVSWSAGRDADRPLAASTATGTWYLATDQKKLYRMGASDWDLVFSLDVRNLMNYDTLVLQTEVSTVAGAAKIPRADADGKLTFDTTGSAAKVAGYPVDTTDIKDGTTLVYRDASACFVMERKGGSGGSGDSEISDSEVSTGTTYSSKKIETLLAEKADKTGNFSAVFMVEAFDANGEPSKVSTGSTVYTITRDTDGRLTAITDGTTTIAAKYNDAGQFLGMEEKTDA